MPDGTNYIPRPDFTTFTTAGKLRYLADFMETLKPEQVRMRVVHTVCGTAHCAYGWGEVIGLIDIDPSWQTGCISPQVIRGLGLNSEQWMHAFGDGTQFAYLPRAYTLADVARHLREGAAEVD